MKALRLLALVGLLAVAAAAEDKTPLQFTRIDLLDGRTLTDVILKTYDAASGNILLVADHTAMLVPARLIPAPLAEQFKRELPKAGATTAVVAATAIVAPPGAQPAPPAAPPVVAVVPVPVGTGTAAPVAADPAGMHRAAAEARAARYYRYEFRAGSDAMLVTSLHIETNPPEAVEGWPGRYRTQGQAFLEFYDSKGGSFSRATDRFEVLTEQKPGQPVTVVSFIRK